MEVNTDDNDNEKQKNLDWLKIQVDTLNRLGQADEFSRQEREAIRAGHDALKTLIFHAEAELRMTKTRNVTLQVLLPLPTPEPRR